MTRTAWIDQHTGGCERVVIVLDVMTSPSLSLSLSLSLPPSLSPLSLPTHPRMLWTYRMTKDKLSWTALRTRSGRWFETIPVGEDRSLRVNISQSSDSWWMRTVQRNQSDGHKTRRPSGPFRRWRYPSGLTTLGTWNVFMYCKAIFFTYVCDKFIQFCQNGPLDKFMRVLFMCSSILCTVMYGAIKIYAVQIYAICAWLA